MSIVKRINATNLGQSNTGNIFERSVFYRITETVNICNKLGDVVINIIICACKMLHINYDFYVEQW